jgi:hypothetical protein
MGRARYLVDAIVLEGRSPRELAKSHGISRSWIYELVARYRRGGYAALEPRSHRPRSCPHQVRPRLAEAILAPGVGARASGDPLRPLARLSPPDLRQGRTFPPNPEAFPRQQPAPTSLQAQLDAFRTYYNQRRPHRALAQRTPLVAFNAGFGPGPRSSRHRRSFACDSTRSIARGA